MDENSQPRKQFDVSAVVRLRKRVGHAATSLKFIGFFWAIALLFEVPQGLDFKFLLLSGAMFYLLAWQIAELLKSGNARGAIMAAAWWAFWTTIALLVAWETVRAANLNSFSFIRMLLLLVLLYFLGRGLFEFVAYRLFQKTSANVDNPLALYPWEAGGSSLNRQQFLSNKSLSAYWFLLLSPFPWLLVVAVGMQKKSPAPSDSAEFTGVLTATAAFHFAAWIAVANIYRLARRHAMLPASEIIKIDVRPITLFLRSFQDDSRLRLWARTTNGRILPERLVKIAFEEVVTDHLWRYGPVVGIGDPRARSKLSPALGAAKDYATDADWRDTVTPLIQNASIIVATIGETEGLVWELNRIVGLGLSGKLVLLFPPLPVKTLERRWQFLVENAASADLPPKVDFQRTRAVIFSEGGASFITGDWRNDWTYEAVLDEATLVISGSRNSRQTPSKVNINYPTFAAGRQTRRIDNIQDALDSMAPEENLHGEVLSSAPSQPAAGKEERMRAPGALASVVWGIIGLITFPWLLWWVTIAYAKRAKLLIALNPRLYGERMATWGYVLGVLNILEALIFIYFFLVAVFHKL